MKEPERQGAPVNDAETDGERHQAGRVGRGVGKIVSRARGVNMIAHSEEKIKEIPLRDEQKMRFCLSLLLDVSRNVITMRT